MRKIAGLYQPPPPPPPPPPPDEPPDEKPEEEPEEELRGGAGMVEAMVEAIELENLPTFSLNRLSRNNEPEYQDGW